MEMRDLIIPMALAGAIVVLGVIVIDGISEEGRPDYEYLQCVPFSDFGEGVTSVTGCAETVTIAGVQYLRMTDVGEFYVYKGSEMRSYRVGPAVLDVFLQSGQSNAYFYSNPGAWPDGESSSPDPNPGGPSPIAPGQALYFGRPGYAGWFGGVPFPANVDTSEIYDFVSDDGHVKIANTYPVLLYDYINVTGHRVLMLNASMGGYSILLFAPGKGGYDFIESVISHAKEHLDPAKFTLNTVAVLWLQGESDRNMAASEYEWRFLSLVDDFTSGRLGMAFPRVLTALPASHLEGDLGGGALGQMAAAQADDRITVATSIALGFPSELPYYRDGIHYTQTVFNWIGEAFARTALEATGFQAPPESLVVFQSGSYAGSPPSGGVAVGTSGEEYGISVEWDLSQIDGPGVYTVAGTASWTPGGVVPSPAMAIQAEVTIR